MSNIFDLVIDAVNSRLLIDMQSLIDETDIARAGLVRAGVLQDNPLKFGVSVLTHPNDISDPKSWPHAVVSGAGEKLGLQSYPYEIGGGEMWYRRFSTQIEQFWKAGTPRESARRFSGTVLSRAEHAIKNANIAVGADSFGETPIAVYLSSSYNSEGGGGNQFIWRGFIWWQCLTERP